MITKRSVLVIVVATVLVFSMVGMASGEVGTQKWYWTNYATDLPTNADYQMNKTSGQGTDFVHEIGASTVLIWVADEAVTSGPLDMHGSWTGNIEYYVHGTGDIKLKAEIGVLTGGGAFTPKATTTHEGTGESGVKDWDISLTPDPFSISNGQYLAVQFTNLAGSSTINLLTYYTYDPNANGPTLINSPSTDPGYPVPELSTLLLTSVGMLMLGGFVVYSRRRNNK